MHPDDQLLGAIRDLSFARDLPSVTAVLRTVARRLTGADGVTFVLREAGLCHYLDEDAIGPLWKGRRFPLNECISGWVMLNRKPAAIPDIYADPRIPHDAYRPTFVRSLVMMPVRSEDPIAAIGAYWARIHTASEAEVTTLQVLANAAALALANAQLYQDLQKSAENEHRARLAAEDASRMKDELLAILSHELRTPLNVIQGWTWQLRKQGGTDLARRAVETIERNVKTEIALIDNLLDVSQILAGKMQLRPGTVDVGEVCRDVVAQASAGTAGHGPKLAYRGDDAPLEVRGDPDRVKQVVSHLVANAVKFTPAGGEVDVQAVRRGDQVQIRVRDTGVGIAPEFLPFIFHAFRQADSGTARRFGGLGLGLSIVKHFVELHGGSVEISSDGEGRGTTATVLLPIHAERLPATAAPTELAARTPCAGL